MFTQQLRWSADARRLPVQAAVVAMGAVALAGCNPSKNAYVPPPPPKVVVAQPFAETGDPLSRIDRQYSGVQLRRPRRARSRLSRIDRLRGRRIRDQGNAAVRHRARQLSAAARPGERRRSPPIEATLEYNKAEYQRQSTLARQDFASQVDCAAMEGQSGFGGGAGAERQGGDRTRQDQSRLYGRYRAL